MPTKVKFGQVPLTTGRHSIGRFSKTQLFGRKKKHKTSKLQKAGKLKAPKKIEKQKKTSAPKQYKFKTKKGVERAMTVNPKIVPPSTEGQRHRVRNTRVTTNPTRIRPSITPGTILILVAGRFAGKRVVCLKALPSGLLLITGPFKLNGVPLRRVNQRYVIATQTHVDVSKVDTSKVTDAIFKKPKKAPVKKSAPKTDDLFKKEEKKKVPMSDERKALQKTIDEPLLATVKGVEHLESYLSQTFGLKKGQHPHLMKF